MTRKNSWIAVIWFIGLMKPAAASSHCTTSIERALQAQRILIDNMTVDRRALQGLAVGYLQHETCTVDDIKNVSAPGYTVNIGRAGDGSTLVFKATFKRCGTNFSLTPQNGKIANISVDCGRDSF